MRKGSHMSEESKQKISNASKGRVFSKETRKKLSDAALNREKEHNQKISRSNIGKHEMSKEHKEKLMQMSRERKITNETRIKMSIAGKRRPAMSEETREKISKSNKGRPMCESTKIKLLKIHTGMHYSTKTIIKMSEAHRGEKCNFWKGGISFEPYCPMWTKELKERIRAFFEYRCICCGKHQTELKRKLNCHHVEYNKKACCDGKPVHFAAMCGTHHIKTNFERERWEYMLHRIIEEIYDGKSYYTKEEYIKMCINKEGQV